MDARECFLAHHGILGQKWGRKNGPPYPLSASKHSAAEKKAGWQKSLEGGKDHGLSNKTQNNKMVDTKGMTKKQKEEALKRYYDHSGSDAGQQKARFAVSTLLSAAIATGVNPVVGGAYLAYDGKRAYDAFMASEKEKQSNERKSSLKLDKQTGLRVKNRTWDQLDDVKAVNPGFKNFDSNTKKNCFLCSMTYDLRRRGYDATAKKAIYGYFNDDVNRWYQGAKVNDVTHKNAKGKFDSETTYTNLNTALSSQKQGSRGMVNVTWKGMVGGHSLAYDVTKDGVKIYDAQSGKEQDMRKLVKRSQEVSYTRLDNLKLNKQHIREVAE